MTQRRATATAHANIALIKYWGKRDEELVLPYTSSLSLTLDGLRTVTTVKFGDLAADTATLDGEPLHGIALTRISTFLDLVRERAGFHSHATVISRNEVPTAAGLASSASGFAALAGAAAAAAGLDLDARALSRLARRGSGSASRSIYGGLALWHAGHDDESSFAEPVHSPLDLAILVILVDDGVKSVSSRVAMRSTVATSPLFFRWVEDSARDLEIALRAVAEGDLATLGETAEANALGMHATMRAAVPPISYFTSGTQDALAAVREARAAGLPAWATIDAGANVKVLTSAADAERLAEWLRARLAGLTISVDYPGPGIAIDKG